MGGEGGVVLNVSLEGFHNNVFWVGASSGLHRPLGEV